MAARRPAQTQKHLSLERILEVAAGLIEEAGFDALTMRAVAERLGVTAMSLYRYVRTKQDLLTILANRTLDELELPEPGALPWDEEIREVMRSLHRLLLAHPEFVAITASQPMDTMVAYRGMELVLGTLQQEGLGDADAVAAYDALVSFVRGFNSQHAGARARATSPVERLHTMRGLHEDEFPHVVRLAGLLITRDPVRHFDDGLYVVIRGIQGQIEDARAAG
jgi:AcrR family transcriptional regulator